LKDFGSANFLFNSQEMRPYGNGSDSLSTSLNRSAPSHDLCRATWETAARFANNENSASESAQHFHVMLTQAIAPFFRF
jgi:hypothetical protein